jgi:hypothetical protein
MYIPLMRECVCVEGRQGPYMVVAIDYERQCSDLIGVLGKERLTGISFASLFEMAHAPAPMQQRENPLRC